MKYFYGHANLHGGKHRIIGQVHHDGKFGLTENIHLDPRPWLKTVCPTQSSPIRATKKCVFFCILEQNREVKSFFSLQMALNHHILMDRNLQNPKDFMSCKARDDLINVKGKHNQIITCWPYTQLYMHVMKGLGYKIIHTIFRLKSCPSLRENRLFFIHLTHF